MNYHIVERPDSYMKYQPDLLHLTDSFDKLCSIIENGLRPSYCKETLSSETDPVHNLSVYVPMVSFSSWNGYSHLKLRSYGAYGIILNSGWAEKNKLNPILYLNENSHICHLLFQAFTEIKQNSAHYRARELHEENQHHRSLFYKLSVSTLLHSKNACSPLVRGERIEVKKYPFVEEREWRYLVKDPSIQQFLFWDIPQEEREVHNKKLSTKYLTFKASDIEGILVPTEYEVEKIKEALEKKFGANQIKIDINNQWCG